VLLELGLAEMTARRDPRAVQDLRQGVAMMDGPSERAAAALRAGRVLGAGGQFHEASAILEAVRDPDLRIDAELAANRFQLASQTPAAVAPDRAGI
jgi:hypothetical protein